MEFRGWVCVFFLISSWVGAVGPLIDCSKSAPEQDTPISQGEWILRCRYRDAQPQYTVRSLGRLLSRFSPEKIKPGETAKSFDYLARQHVREAIFEEYGLFFDDRNSDPTVPFGFSKTVEEMTPLMGGPSGKIFYSRLLSHTKRVEGVSVNCLVCHTGIVPTTVDGVGAVSFATPNVFVDLQKLHEAFQGDLAQYEQKDFPGAGLLGHAVERNPRGNSFVNSADYYGVLARLVRQPYPRIKLLRLADYLYALPEVSPEVEALRGVAQTQPYLKTQPWGSYRYKAPLNRLYVDGGFSGNPAAVTYRLAFSKDREGQDYLEYAEEFRNFVPEFFNKIEPPVYPFPVRQSAIVAGHQIYEDRCAQCHGSFTRAGSKWNLDYQGEIVPNVGTDGQRYQFFTKVIPDFVERIGGLEEAPKELEAKVLHHPGYIAPPLVGIWARAPYLHNASVPNIRQLLGNPSARSAQFGVWPRPTDHRYYDQKNVGWKSVDLTGLSLLEIEAFKSKTPENANLRVYTQDAEFRFYDKKKIPGLSNQGHDLITPVMGGRYLADKELDALLEFLKTI